MFLEALSFLRSGAAHRIEALEEQVEVLLELDDPECVLGVVLRGTGGE